MLFFFLNLYFKMENKKSLTLKEEVSQSLRETLESSAVHGFSNIIRNPHTAIKIIWTIAVLISASYCIYSIYNWFFQYFLHQVVTDVDIKHESQIEFPIIKYIILSHIYIYSRYQIDVKFYFINTKPSLEFARMTCLCQLKMRT